MPSRFALVLVGLAFLITVLARLPASTVSALLPRQLMCIEPSGTLWHGSCAQLRSGANSVSDLHWSLHAAPLLRARAQLDLYSTDPGATGRARVTLRSNGDADISDLSLTLPLQGGLVPVPPGWSGQLQLEIGHAMLIARHLDSIEGIIRVLQLHLDRPAMDFGGFELDFPPASPGSPLAGSLRDLGGPVALQGTVQISGSSYQVDGVIANRDASNASLEQLLQLLGPPDAQGRHPFSIAGTY